MWDHSDRPKPPAAKPKRLDRAFGQGSLRFKRIQAGLQVAQGLGLPPKSIEGRIVLNDLGPEGLFIFTAEALPPDSEVEVNLSFPRTLNVYGKVTGCWLAEQSGRVQSAKVFPFRLRIDFTFLNEGDATAVREYCADLEGPQAQRKKAA